MICCFISCSKDFTESPNLGQHSTAFLKPCILFLHSSAVRHPSDPEWLTRSHYQVFRQFFAFRNVECWSSSIGMRSWTKIRKNLQKHIYIHTTHNRLQKGLAMAPCKSVYSSHCASQQQWRELHSSRSLSWTLCCFAAAPLWPPERSSTSFIKPLWKEQKKFSISTFHQMILIVQKLQSEISLRFSELKSS